MPPDGWRAYQLDAAASLFGDWVEGKLGQRTEEGLPRYDLGALVGDRPPTEAPAPEAPPRPKKQYRSFLGG
jgi:hypothetical protein